MEMRSEEKGGLTFIRLQGRLDAATSAAIQEKIIALIDAGHHKLLIDFEHIDYLSSAGMRLLLAVAKKVKQVEGKIALFQIQPEVIEVMQMAGFDKVLNTYPTEQEAVSRFA